jgi:hypothetical protein
VKRTEQTAMTSNLAGATARSGGLMAKSVGAASVG